MTAIKKSSVTIVGEDSERDAELATLLGAQFEVSLKRPCQESFESIVDDRTDILLVFDESSDCDAMSWIAELYSQRALPIVFFSHTDEKQRIHDAIAAGVSSFVYDGYRASRVPSIIETVVARFEQRVALEQELMTARKNLDDRKIIDRAKGLIMAQRGCSEEEAYASLRRRAMDSNRKIADFAKDVLMVSEVLKGK